MAATFQALRTYRDEAGARSVIETLPVPDVGEGEVLVRIRWAGVNYKDSLAVTGRPGLLEGSPRIAGIEFVGVVEESGSPAFEPGTAVLVHGFGTGIARDGGFSELARVPQDHVMRVPEGLEPHEAALLGVPAFTVALALDRFQSLGLTPQAGPVAVSGATGAVGMLAVAILSRLGYPVVALTRREDFAGTLRSLGAAEVMTTAGVAEATRPLEKGRFAAAIDNVGGEVLSWLLRSLLPSGLVAAVGNASGIALATNVLPFILRQAHLFGVVANAPWPQRHRLWSRLAGDWKPDLATLWPHVRQIGLHDLPGHCRRQVGGATSGRTLVACGPGDGPARG